MTGRHNGQTTKLSFHHGDRASLLIAIFRCAGMLHKHPCTPHLLHHCIRRKNTWELDKMLKSQLVSPFLHDGKERAIAHHHQAADISMIRKALQESESLQGVQRTFFGHKAAHRQKPRRHGCGSGTLKSLLIGTGWTDHELCRLGSEGNQSAPHRLVLDDHSRGELKQAAVALLEALQVTLR